MKLWKRAGSVGLSLALCAGLVLPALAHTVTIDGKTDTVDTVQEGVGKIEASASQSGTITMDHNDDTGARISKGNVTLDLAGNALTGGNDGIRVSGGELTLKDSGTGGTVRGEGGDGVSVTGGKATITGGTVSSFKGTGMEVTGGTVTISDGTVSSVSASDGGTVTISDGTVSNGVSVSEGGTVTISGGNISGGTAGVKVNGGKVEITGGTVSSSIDTGVQVKDGTANITGGTIYGSVPKNVDTSKVTVKDAPYVPPTPGPAPASDPLTRPAAARTLLEELFRRAGGSGELWSWAVENGLIDEDGDGDEIVTEALLRSILTRYAEAFGGNAVAAEDLTTLTGEDTDVVDNCRAVLNEFFGG